MNVLLPECQAGGCLHKARKICVDCRLFLCETHAYITNKLTFCRACHQKRSAPKTISDRHSPTRK